VPLADLEDKQKDAFTGLYLFLTIIKNLTDGIGSDVLAVVHKVSDVQSITTKQGKPLSKRELTLADRSGYICQLTLWGKQAEQWNHPDHPIVAFKGLRVGEFGGKSLYVLVAPLAD
jgi:hypothetical protein